MATPFAVRICGADLVLLHAIDQDDQQSGSGQAKVDARRAKDVSFHASRVVAVAADEATAANAPGDT